MINNKDSSSAAGHFSYYHPPPVIMIPQRGRVITLPRQKNSDHELATGQDGLSDTVSLSQTLLFSGESIYSRMLFPFFVIKE